MTKAIFTSQCKEGKVTTTYTQNGTPFFSSFFNIRKRIPEGKVPHFPQYGEPTVPGFNWANEPYGETGASTISKKGCALCALAQLASYHLTSQRKSITTPPQLNAALRDNGGYDGFRIRWERVPFVMQKVYGISLKFLGHEYPFAPVDICFFGPQLFHLGVGSGNHWVTVHGQSCPGDEPGNFLSNDPGNMLAFGGRDRCLSFYAPVGIPIKKTREYVGPEFQVTIRNGFITVAFHSPGDIFVTDPQGRRTGVDPLTNRAFNEIPHSMHQIEGIDDHDTPEVTPGTLPDDAVKLVSITNPVLLGDYTVTVTGTETGTYTLDINLYDAQNQQATKRFVGVPIAPGAVHRYQFTHTLPLVEGSEAAVAGGFDGGGQRPKDVNKFLSYANPTDSQTSLPAGTTTFPLLIIYNKSIIPSSFKAEMDRVDVTSLFSPKPGGAQLVNIPLQKGRSTLVLSVDGSLPNRVATDTDRLVFIVP